MNTLAIVQARMGSTRLPQKTLLPISGKPMLAHILDRVRRSETLDGIVVATTQEAQDDMLVDFVQQYGHGVEVFRGSEHDVLDRFLQAAAQQNAETIVRLTGDNPLVSPVVIDRVVREFEGRPDCAYASNVVGEHTYPLGLSVEVVRRSALERIASLTQDADDHEHVTLYIRKHPETFPVVSVSHDCDLSEYRWTVDEPRDLAFIRAVYDALYQDGVPFDIGEVVALLEANPDLTRINCDVEQKLANFF
jgi:spore coat polysaccharide biosynthesis protein SpsF